MTGRWEHALKGGINRAVSIANEIRTIDEVRHMCSLTLVSVSRDLKRLVSRPLNFENSSSPRIYENQSATIWLEMTGVSMQGQKLLGTGLGQYPIFRRLATSVMEHVCT